MGALGEARWTYAVSKLAGEHLAHGYYKEHGLGTVVIRPFNVYGPGQIGEGAIHTFVKRALAGRGPRDPRRRHPDPRLVLHRRHRAGAARVPRSATRRSGESFNIGNARAVITVYGLANAVVRITGSKSQIRLPRRGRSRRRAPGPQRRQGARGARLRGRGRPGRGHPADRRLVQRARAGATPAPVTAARPDAGGTMKVLVTGGIGFLGIPSRSSACSPRAIARSHHRPAPDGPDSPSTRT